MAPRTLGRTSCHDACLVISIDAQGGGRRFYRDRPRARLPLRVVGMAVLVAGMTGVCLAFLLGMYAMPSFCVWSAWCTDDVEMVIASTALPTSPWRALWRTATYAIRYMDLAFPALVVSLVLSVLAFGMTYLAIQYAQSAFVVGGLGGVDLLKRDLLPHGQKPPVIPESLGLVCAVIYLLILVAFIPFRYFGANMYGLPSSLAGDVYSSPGLHQDLASFLSALLSVYSGAFLGFVDDVLDIRWRYKLPIPLLSSIPMLAVYMAGGGTTGVVIPAWPPILRDVLGCSTMELGALYYVFMMMLATFCTNCINILAGINGVEVGQATVIALSICVNDLLYLDIPAVVRAALINKTPIPYPVDILRGYHGSQDLVIRHLFSLHLLLPFIGTSLALLAWNRYPARVFVGDTYCYFAGMVLVSCGVLGHYSKTLLLFFLPQIFNFLLSCPQLFGLVPCPRHRVPFVDVPSGRLYPSSVRLHASTPRVTHALLALLESCRCVRRLRNETGQVVGVTNMTLLNAVLVMAGARAETVSRADLSASLAVADPALKPRAARSTLYLTERGLWYCTMLVQVIGSVIAFAIRYRLSSVLFPST